MSHHERAIEAAELIAKLRAGKFAPLISAMDNPECFTKGGRVNGSALGREMGVSVSQAHRMLTELRGTVDGWE